MASATKGDGFRVTSIYIGKILHFVGTGAPTNGTSGTGAGKAVVGSTYVNFTTGDTYRNTNTKASPTWVLSFGVTQSAFGLSFFKMARAKYDFAVDGGAVSTLTPAITAALPDNAVIVGGTVNSTTAVLSSGSATLAVGTTAGSSASAILAATAKASLSLDALINAVPVFATPVKLTAAGSINVTIGTAALTAGVVEVTLLYFVAAN